MFLSSSLPFEGLSVKCQAICHLKICQATYHLKIFCQAVCHLKIFLSRYLALKIFPSICHLKILLCNLPFKDLSVRQSVSWRSVKQSAIQISVCQAICHLKLFLSSSLPFKDLSVQCQVICHVKVFLAYDLSLTHLLVNQCSTYRSFCPSAIQESFFHILLFRSDVCHSGSSKKNKTKQNNNKNCKPFRNQFCEADRYLITCFLPSTLPCSGLSTSNPPCIHLFSSNLSF